MEYNNPRNSPEGRKGLFWVLVHEILTMSSRGRQGNIWGSYGVKSWKLDDNTQETEKENMKWGGTIKYQSPPQ